MQHRSTLITFLRRGFPYAARALACAVIALAAAPLGAADWKPTAQIELVIPNSPGGGNDAVGRRRQRDLELSRPESE
jgi:tripartite-type tricarboxylate transporter receptor subunit TctC